MQQSQLGCKRRLELKRPQPKKRVTFKRQLEQCHWLDDTHYATPAKKVPREAYKPNKKKRDDGDGQPRETTRREFTDEEKMRKLERSQETAEQCATKDTAEGCLLLLDRLRQHAIDIWVPTAFAALNEDVQRQEGKPEPDGLVLGLTGDWSNGC